MSKCFFCEKQAGSNEYYTLDICKKCYTRLAINKLENAVPPEDKYLKSFVPENENAYVDALNAYATLFSKSLSGDLFGMTILNAGDEELDSLFAYSMIIAARSVWLFGKDNSGFKKLEPKKVHALHGLGNLIGISIIGGSVNKYKDKLNLEDETGVSMLYEEVDHSMIDILKNLEEYDDGSLHGYILKMIRLIRIFGKE